MVDGNATAAAIRAGYAERSARQTASGLMTKTDIQYEVARLSKARSERLEFTADDILRESKNLALTTMGAFIDEDGFVVGNLKDLPDSALACIQSVEQTTTIDASGNTVIKQRLKLYDRLKALQVAGQHVDIRAFVQQHQVEVSPAAQSLGDRLDAIHQKRNEEIRQFTARGLCHKCKLPIKRAGSGEASTNPLPQ